MSKRRKIAKGMALTLIVSVLLSVQGFANSSFSILNIPGSKNRYYQMSTSPPNVKANTSGWVVRAESLYFPKNVYSWGIAFTLFRSTTNINETYDMWKGTTGRTTGTYKPGYGKVNTSYQIGARLDDVLASYGTGHSTGAWNSDSV